MKTSDTKVLRLIAIFKLLKAALLIAVCVGALRLVHTDVTTLVEKWVARFGLNPSSRHVGHVIVERPPLLRIGSRISQSAAFFTRRSS
jgi:hypothetical protein